MLLQMKEQRTEEFGSPPSQCLGGHSGCTISISTEQSAIAMLCDVYWIASYKMTSTVKTKKEKKQMQTAMVEICRLSDGWLDVQ